MHQLSGQLVLHNSAQPNLADYWEGRHPSLLSSSPFLSLSFLVVLTCKIIYVKVTICVWELTCKIIYAKSYYVRLRIARINDALKNMRLRIVMMREKYAFENY